MCIVLQITTLVNHKERTKVTEKTARALAKVGEAVSQAVERFVLVGESIGNEHAELRSDMCETCMEAREAGICSVLKKKPVSFSTPPPKF